jgi:hypothetical protein
MDDTLRARVPSILFKRVEAYIKVRQDAGEGEYDQAALVREALRDFLSRHEPPSSTVKSGAVQLLNKAAGTSSPDPKL